MAATLNKAWLAGFIDGEGCISVTKSMGKGRDTPRFGLRLQIVQKDPFPLVHIQNGLGGSIYKRKSMTGHPVSVIQFNGGVAYQVLRDVVKFLVLKKAQAEIAIKFYELRLERNSNTNKRYSVNEIKEYTVMYQVSRALKKQEVS